MRRRLPDGIGAMVAHLTQGAPEAVWEALWRDALAQGVRAAIAMRGEEDGRLPPTTVRLRPSTAAFFRTVGESLGLSTQAAIAMALDGLVAQAIASASGPAASV